MPFVGSSAKTPPNLPVIFRRWDVSSSSSLGSSENEMVETNNDNKDKDETKENIEEEEEGPLDNTSKGKRIQIAAWPVKCQRIAQ